MRSYHPPGATDSLCDSIAQQAPLTGTEWVADHDQIEVPRARPPLICIDQTLEVLVVAARSDVEKEWAINKPTGSIGRQYPERGAGGVGHDLQPRSKVGILVSALFQSGEGNADYNVGSL